MKLSFEKSVAGRRCSMLPACDVETVELPEGFARTEAPALPEMSETDISRAVYKRQVDLLERSS